MFHTPEWSPCFEMDRAGEPTPWQLKSGFSDQNARRMPWGYFYTVGSVCPVLSVVTSMVVEVEDM